MFGGGVIQCKNCDVTSKTWLHLVCLWCNLSWRNGNLKRSEIKGFKLQDTVISVSVIPSNRGANGALHQHPDEEQTMHLSSGEPQWGEAEHSLFFKIIQDISSSNLCQPLAKLKCHIWRTFQKREMNTEAAALILVGLKVRGRFLLFLLLPDSEQGGRTGSIAMKGSFHWEFTKICCSIRRRPCCHEQCLFYQKLQQE